VSAAVELKSLLLPGDWPLAQLEAEARRIYFDDLVPNPPETPFCAWLERRGLIVANSEGGFQKIFGETTGWAGYAHRKTGRLCPERMRRAPWIRPVLEMKVPKTKIYVNRHSMQPREYGPAATGKRNRIFVTTGSDLLYFISLVYTEHGLALATAFEPDGQWLRETLKSHGTVLLGPPWP
jgi:hypothetical protein